MLPAVVHSVSLELAFLSQDGGENKHGSISLVVGKYTCAKVKTPLASHFVFVLQNKDIKI